VHTGHASRLYDLQDTQDFDHSLAKSRNLDLGNTYGAFLNPPFFAWIFAPLVLLGYWKSLIAWEILNLICFGCACALLCKILPPRYDPDPNLEPKRDWRDFALVPALMTVSLPFIQAVGHGQNTCLSLLLMTCAAVLWRKGRSFYAGVAAGMMFYKPQLAAVILAAMVITLGWRTIAGAALSLGALLVVNIFTLPGTISDYLHRLTPNVQMMLAAHPYLWMRHVTFNGFWHVSNLQIHPFDHSTTAQILAVICSMPVAFGLALCVWRHRHSASRDRMIAAVICATPLIMPYYLDYDLLVLAIPAVLLAAEMIDRDAASALPARDRWLLRLWMFFFVLLLVNPMLTKLLQINLSVPFLVAIAGLMIARALRPDALAANNSNYALGSFQWAAAS
jgi:hypothetical protein